MSDIIWNDEYNKLSFDYLEKSDGYHNYFINVKSGIFGGGSNFCISIENIELIKKINVNNLSDKEDIIINDYDGDSFIKFTILNKFGKVVVNGLVGGSYNKNNLKFEFIADQTILQNIKNLFAKCN